jgi:hypothetical protein
MATRFRLPSSGAAGASPTAQSYTHTPGTPPRRILPLADSSALGNTAQTPDAADHLVAGDTYHVQFVSDLLAAQTFTSGDAFKYALQAFEANANNEQQLQIYIGVWNGASVTTIRSKTAEGTELATSLTNRFFSGTLSATHSCGTGDRLVVEFSITGTPGPAATGVQGHNATLRWGSNGASGDLPENDTDTATDKNPWIEFANTIVFQQQAARAMYHHKRRGA